MKYGKYIREHAVWLGIFALLLFTIETFLLTLVHSGWLMVYVGIALVVSFFLGTGWEFWKEKKYFEKHTEMLEQLDKKYLYPELMGTPGSQEEKAIFEMLSMMEVGMNNEVSDYRRKSEEYKEYIETWVHEVKIPIATSQMLFTNHQRDLKALAAKDLSPEEEKLLEMEMNFAESQETETARIESYVEQALFYARSAEVEKDYFIKAIDLEQIVNDVIRQKKKVLIAKKARINIYDLVPEKEILSDGKWLSFIVGQIVDNAIKYAKEEGPSLEIFCKKVINEMPREGRKFGEKDESYALIIRDQGIGMKSAEVERAFDKGFTGSNGRTNKASTGIGLYLCKKLCNRLEHEIHLQSVEGEGTEVSIRF